MSISHLPGYSNEDHVVAANFTYMVLSVKSIFLNACHRHEATEFKPETVQIRLIARDGARQMGRIYSAITARARTTLMHADRLGITT